MSAAPLIEIGWKSFLVAALLLALLYLLKGRSASERSAIAHAGLLALMVVPLAILAGPRLTVEAPQWLASMTDQAALSAASEPFASPGSIALADGAPLVSAASKADPTLAIDLAWTIYIIPVLALLLVALLAVARLHRLRRRATVLVEPAWLSALARAQRRIGMKHGTALLGSGEVGSPVSWGVVRPVIMLGEDAAANPAAAEPIIAHELAHVAHLDWAKLLLGRVAIAVLWFNPLVWLLVRHCHQLREEAADDAVLASGVAEDEYAALLLGAARGDRCPKLLAANGVAPGRGSLHRRIARVLDADAPRRRAAVSWSAACVLGAVLLATPLAATAFVPSKRIAPPPFTAVELRGGGDVTLRYGAVPAVTLVRGSSARTRTALDGRTLVIDACATSCRDYRPALEIVVPRLDHVTVRGGGAVQSRGRFPDQAALAAEVVDGGLIRVGGIEARRVRATIEGGGTIKTTVREGLDAAIRGDGSIVYWGDPAVASAVSGGGVVVRADDD